MLNAESLAKVTHVFGHNQLHVGDECMHGPYRVKLLEMGALGALLRAALTSVMDEECDMVVQQVRYFSYICSNKDALKITGETSLGCSIIHWFGAAWPKQSD
jgi:hypothetical protein